MKEMAQDFKDSEAEDPILWEDWGQVSEEFVYLTRSSTPKPTTE